MRGEGVWGGGEINSRWRPIEQCQAGGSLEIPPLLGDQHGVCCEGAFIACCLHP